MLGMLIIISPTISSILSPNSPGTSIAFTRDFSPLTIRKSLLAQPILFDKKLSNSAFAFPSSATAASRIRSRPSLTPANSVFEAPGIAFISNLILSPSIRKQLFILLLPASYAKCSHYRVTLLPHDKNASSAQTIAALALAKKTSIYNYSLFCKSISLICNAIPVRCKFAQSTSNCSAGVCDKGIQRLVA